MEYLYEGLGMVVFILISMLFITNPPWVKRWLVAVARRLDRWI